MAGGSAFTVCHSLAQQLSSSSKCPENIRANKLHIFHDNKWKPLKNKQNWLKREKATRYAIRLMSRSSGVDKNDEGALLVKIINYGKADNKPEKLKNRLIYINSNRQLGWFSRWFAENPIGLMNLRIYILVHLRKYKIGRTLLAGFHFKYRNRGRSQDTYSELRAIAFLFDEIDIKVIGKDSARLARLISALKTGRVSKQIRKDLRFITSAHAKKFKFEKSPKTTKNKIINFILVLRKYNFFKRKSGVSICFNTDHSNLSSDQIETSTIKYVDFDGSTNPRILGNSQTVKIHWTD